MTHGVAHSPVPVNTVSSNKPGIACAPACTVLSQQVLNKKNSSHGSEQTTVSISTHCPCLCNHHIGCPSNNSQFPSPLFVLLCSATPSLLQTKQTPLGEVVKLLMQKYCVREGINYSLSLFSGRSWSLTQRKSKYEFVCIFIQYSLFNNRVCKLYTAVELFIQQNTGWFKKYKGILGHRVIGLQSYVRRQEVMQIVLPH